MPIYNIRGINVDFPYNAYDCQIAYMDKVIQSLQERNNALLESPTGTGKTLCLLCATLAYRASLGPFSTGPNTKKNDDVGPSQSSGSLLPKIVYTSRTHSQLRQVVLELKKTNYRPKMVVLGSREQLCIHDKVKELKGKAQNNACNYVRKGRNKQSCKHHRLTTEFIKSNPQIGEEPIDIEDLVNIGRTCGPCPYYVSRELIKCVDILFAPYNYLIERTYKSSLGIGWNSSILIFDEAHNLEGICADAESFDLPSTLLSACISEAKNCIDISVKRRDLGNSSDMSSNPDNFAILRGLLLKLEKRIAEIQIESKDLGFTRPGPYIYELLADLNVTSDTASQLTATIEEAAILLEEDANGLDSKQSQGTSCRLETMGNILKLIFREGNTSHAKYYCLHVHERLTTDSNTFKGNGSSSRTLSWWCFNPGISMEDFSKRGVASVILTSGTLSPMSSFAYEFNLEFPIRLENPHVISSNQIWAGVVPVGPSGYSLNSTYRNRDVLEYKQDLGNAIVNFARIVPDGLLVFFSSYYAMEQCINFWKGNSHGVVASQSTIWERICKFKHPVVEPRHSSLFASSIEDFMSKLKNPSISGAVFFAVCRGKVSEGLDFADHYGRAVVVTGLPFATWTDPKVRLKREFLDEHTRDKSIAHKPLTGDEWYDQQASRAVNQAVGRVIRHRYDYGAIIFCDGRFALSNRQAQISRWIQPHIKSFSTFGDVVYSLTRFFRDVPVKAETAEPVSNGKICSENDPRSRESCCSKMKFNTVDVDEDCCIISSSVGIRAEKSKNENQLCDALPANRSSLVPQKLTQAFSLKQPSFLFRKDSKIRLSGSTYGLKTSETVDLTSDDSANQKSDVKLLVNCSSTRKRVLESKSDNMEYKKFSCDMGSGITEVKLEESPLRNDYIEEGKCENSLTKKMKNVIASSSVEVACNITAQATDSNQANQGALSSFSQDEEAKGYNFLSQVQQKLNESEYREFVGYMKALKSKAMTIRSVLQSIAELFSGQERHPLLRRFKHYVPAKYHSLYDECCKTVGLKCKASFLVDP